MEIKKKKHSVILIDYGLAQPPSKNCPPVVHGKKYTQPDYVQKVRGHGTLSPKRDIPQKAPLLRSQKTVGKRRQEQS